jgi:hypothetical protein
LENADIEGEGIAKERAEAPLKETEDDALAATDPKNLSRKQDARALPGGAARMLADITRRRKAMRDSREGQPDPPVG